MHLVSLYLHESVHLRQNKESKGQRLRDPREKSLILDEVEAYMLQAMFLNGFIKVKGLEEMENFYSAIKKAYGKVSKKAYIKEIAYSYQNYSEHQVEGIEKSINYITKGKPKDGKVSEKIYQHILLNLIEIEEPYHDSEEIEKYLKGVRLSAKEKLKKQLKSY